MNIMRLTKDFCCDCTFRLVSQISYVLVCAVYLSQAKTTNFSSESPFTVFHQSISNNESKIQSSQVLNSEGLALQNITGKTWNSTFGYKNIENDSTEILDSLDEYDDFAADFNLPYIGPEVVVDLGPKELILSHDERPPGDRRRPVVKDGFVYEQQMELLRLHNLYRSNVTPPAADMNFMEWDAYLAKAAQDWADGCRFMHAFPLYVEPGSMGQNLYMGFDPTGVRALLLWNEEYHDYDIKTRNCVPGKQCGHYTQLAWGDSKLVGCGMKRCAIRRFLVVCHYSPIGNIAGFAPYSIGRPCSQCRTTDGGLCSNNMCVTKEQCGRRPDECKHECPLKCHNCGTLDKDSCRCECSDGWDSLDCSRPCKDAHDRCGKNPGWPSVTSCPMNDHAVAETYCRKMCGKCRGTQRSDPENLCCNGTICPDGHVLRKRENGCECDLLCPGPLCHITPDYDVLEATTADDGSSHHPKTIYEAFTLVVLINISLVLSMYGL